MGEEYERILLVKPDVFIYKIPPRTTNRGYRASDWKLDEPDWTGRLRVVAKGKECTIKIEDKTSGALFAQCPVDKYPGVAIEAVSDSSRYFVVKIVDDNGRSAFIGIGFGDRGDSFDLNVSLSDHFKWLEKQEEIEKGGALGDDSTPKLDLKFKEGQTIKVNLNLPQKKTSATGRPKAKGSGSGILLPPPPGAGTVKLPGPSSTTSDAPAPKNTEISSSAPKAEVQATQATNATGKSDSELLLEFDGLSLASTGATASKAEPLPVAQSAASAGANDWAQF